MIAAVEAESQVQRRLEDLRVERFRPAQLQEPKEDAQEDAQLEVTVSQSSVTAEVPPEKTILEVARENGIFVLSSCEEGICGTCLTRALEGKPDHRDSVLSESERAASDQMLISVSRSKSQRLTLDI